MTDKWTPGPWRVDPSGFGPIGGFTISDEKNGFGLCQRAPWPNRAEESAANARLMAEAPALVEALDALLWLDTADEFELMNRFAAEDDPEGACENARANAISATRAVLARVRGEKEKG